MNENGVRKLLQGLNINKAVGPDNIPNRILKECAEEITPAVTNIFQRSIDSSELPDDWLNANISPVFKKGNRHQAVNYRPVSLTPVLSKMLEHIICSNLHSHLQSNNILTSLNHGFRRGHSCETQLALTVNDLVTNLDKKNQTDVLILDFSKAFDTVPHERLLLKLDAYGVQGQLHSWIRSFLCNRQMRVVIDGECSSKTHVVSGVPQGTVLGPLLFLCFINDLPDAVKSQIRLFADDCLLYRVIRTMRDHTILQEDLKALEDWADTWGMRFNADKCYVLSVKQKTSRFYKLNNTTLKEVPSSMYLGVLLSNNLSFTAHINMICGKASSTLGFIRRNLQHTQAHLRRTAYIALVRSKLEYACPVWDPYKQYEVDMLEKVQRQAARFISNDYKSRTPGCVTEMLKSHNLPTLQTRRQEARLSLLYKISHGLLPSIPPEAYLTPIKNKRRITARSFNNFQHSNIVVRHQNNNTRGYIVPTANTAEYKNSFFVRTVQEWNSLEDDTVCATSVESFRTRLQTSTN